jgi:hypothetical protein
VCSSDLGNNAKENTMTPKPPNHCIKLRQNKMFFGRDSILVKIVDPVVVMPDVDSKTASVKEVISPLRRNGSAPKMENDNHAKVTPRQLSFFPMFLNLVL